MALGGTSRSIAQARTIRGQAGRTQGATLALAAAGIAPSAPIVNLPISPTVPETPLTGGDGLPFDEDAADSPFTPDDPDALAPEGVAELP